ncbi:spiro-SPASM protein [Marispirochaeta aestuarii]|uniref:spiro-SPASM protein n=1 Tax=Marispirochaeta aestuarii TaxID=1963862 RepID=UPI0029C70FF9|nr:spiro-SPASM protein [Marispirochaeta aestuarii]
MANLALINCTSLSQEAFIPLCDGKSAFDLVIELAGKLPDISGLVCLCSRENDLHGKMDGVSCISGIDSPETLFAALQSLCEKQPELNSLFYLYGDTPFVDPALSERMWNNHRRYHADYTFADAYPAGIAPEIIRASAVSALAQLAEGMKGPLKRDTVFEVLRRDINAFEIETEIPPLDLRMLRICLAAEDRAGYMLVKRVCEGGVRGAEALLRYLDENQRILRTLPAYLSVQISAGCPQVCTYCPYPGVAGDVEKLTDTMPVRRFRELLQGYSDFAGRGYVNLSPWGEPALHPEIYDILDTLLDYPNLTGVLETAGIGWDREALKKLADRAGERLIWIVSLDALTEETYRRLRGKGFQEAVDTAMYLLELFPSSAWVQAVRMDSNEEELEKFYRSWKERTENIIIQKYDHFSGRLPQRRVADISPLKRNPCWHLKRDLVVLINGDVPMCREDLDGQYSLGNIFRDGFEAVWKRGEEYYLQHLEQKYPSLCSECDEYYTFNY